MTSRQAISILMLSPFYFRINLKSRLVLLQDFLQLW